MREQPPQTDRFGELIGNSSRMRRVFELIAQVSELETPVVISGESGTGKELVARTIHGRSRRRHGRFVAINCGAVTAALLEHELFGHPRGALTGAERSPEGLLLAASGGSLLLAELGKMAIGVQAKLSRVIQRRRVRRAGDLHERAFDTRILCANDRHLETAVAEGSFRRDLFYRLMVVHLELPALRERGRDVLLLAQHFLTRANARNRTSIVGFDASAARHLLGYRWPGNVRELENAVERAAALSSSLEISSADLLARSATFGGEDLVIDTRNPDELPTLAEMERRYMQRVLARVRGNKTAAARVLGLGRSTLQRRLHPARTGA